MTIPDAEIPQLSSESPQTSQNNSQSTLPIVSFVLGIASLTGPGFLFGIPAIITGALALRKKQGSRELSIAGIVTGSISTAFSLLIIAFVVYVTVWSLNNPEFFQQQVPVEPTFDSMQT